MPRSARTRVAIAASALACAVLIVGLAGCAPAPAPEPTATAVATPTPTGTPDPTFEPTGTARENQEFFDFVNQGLYNGSRPDGRTIVDALVAAGFDKSTMELTPDQTTVKLAADSIIVAVKVKRQCLIGQFLWDEYASEVAPILATGRCLVGTTRPIDW